jgi:hypothetical protein
MADDPRRESQRDARELNDRAAKPMSVKQFVLRRLDQGERDLKVLARQARIQFPSVRVAFSYIRAIRNEWQKASTNPRDPGVI